MGSTQQILSEFIDAWNRGQRPRVEDYLRRSAPGEQHELAGLINAFLEEAPTPQYSPETLARISEQPDVRELAALIDSEAGLWPSVLPRLRRHAKLTRDEVVAGLAGFLGLQGREDDMKPYYHRMEAGTIDPSGVSRRVLEALSRVFRVDLREIEEAGDFQVLAPAGAEPLYLRSADEHDMDMLARMERVQASGPTPAGEMDEVDRLFLGGR